MSEYAWLVPTLPAVSAGIIYFFGKRMPRGGTEVGITAVALALVLSIGIAVEVFSHNVDAAGAVEVGEGHAVTETLVATAGSVGGLNAAVEEAPAIPEGVSSFLYEDSVRWSVLGGEFDIEAGVRIDGLAAMMFLLVTFVSLMVQIYSTGYMHGDSRYTYYFGTLSLFTASMLLLVIANNMLMVLIGWELVGVCSFLLIGFWWEDRKNQDAAIKAFITTKFGDIGLMVGVVALWASFGTFNIGEITAAVQAGDYSQGMLTFALLMLFLGCIGKSAQFPLHTWLPDAMAGPTPVSALIHAATMVTAGVFLIARLYPIFSAAPAAKTAIAIIGGITLLIAGLLALIQDDVKRVLAYSTVSQLGYMVAALAFSYTAGIFHLFTHGFFKALLFLGAGSLIHAAHSNNMSDMGGLRRVMPWTFGTFLVGSLALIAIPPLAGFWSKDEILVSAMEAGTAMGTFIFALAILGGALTAFYMTRALYLVFAGTYRGEGHPHESPPAMVGPLVALAVPSVVIGLANLPAGFFQQYSFSAWTMFSLEYWATHPVEFNMLVAVAASTLALIGILGARALYRFAPEREPLMQLGPLYTVLDNKYYLDWLYFNGIVGPLRDSVAAAMYWTNDRVIDRAVYLAGSGTARLGRATYALGDQKGIDGAVNGLGLSAMWSGAKMRLAQSGNVQLYAGAMFVGVVVLGILFAAGA